MVAFRRLNLMNKLISDLLMDIHRKWCFRGGSGVPKFSKKHFCAKSSVFSGSHRSHKLKETQKTHLFKKKIFSFIHLDPQNSGS